MRPFQVGPTFGLLAQLVVLAALARTVGLGGAGWLVGLTVGLVTAAMLTRGLHRHRAERLGPADRITLARATLAGGVAALTADSYPRAAPVTAVLALTVVALPLDAVDGWVARHTCTTSTLGARFDMEVDAFLILVLSASVARTAGAWVLAIGAARYLFLAAGWLMPWLRGPLPARSWRKVVAATQGVVLTSAVAQVLPHPWTEAALGVSLALLTESFGRDVWWLWCRHPGARVPRVGAAASGGSTLMACLLVWLALVAPYDVSRASAAELLRIPLEGLVLLALLVVLRSTTRRVVAALAGAPLGLLTVVKILDVGFAVALGRPFDPVTDRSYLGSAVGLLTDSIGRTGAVLSLTAASVVGIAVLTVLPLSALRLARLVERRRSTTVRAITALGAVWVLCASFGVRLVPGVAVASTSAIGLARAHASQVRADLQDEQQLARAAAADPLRAVPGDRLLTGLRGKDVLIAFVESYGRVAVQDPALSQQVGPALDAGTGRLRAAGWSARSAFLTSPTFGGLSWLAHSTLQSGLRVDDQRRYDQLVGGDRGTLSGAFKRAGWRTVADVPSNTQDWPEGSTFYGYDTVYDARNTGYAGPRFGYASMPDQYILAAFQRLELARPNHAPVMAEIDLVSSHTPWAPLPHLINWAKVGDGSIFDTMAGDGPSPQTVWRDAQGVRRAYAQSIQYSLD